MKFRLFILMAAMAFVPVNFAAAQDDYSYSDYSDVQELAPEAGGEAIGAETSSGYAAEAASSDEDASWAASTGFDGAPMGGEVTDPSTLEPQPFSAYSNDE